MTEVIVKIEVSGVTRYHALVKPVGSSVFVIKDFMKKTSHPRTISRSPSLDLRKKDVEVTTYNSTDLADISDGIETLGLKLKQAETENSQKQGVDKHDNSN